MRFLPLILRYALPVLWHREIRHLSVHTKTVLTTTGILILLGTTAIILLEWSNPLTLKNLSWKEKILASYFQAVTPRTAGFNTLAMA